MKHAALVALILASACATPGPEETLEAYTEALSHKDFEKAHGLCDESFRADNDPEAMQAYLEQQSSPPWEAPATRARFELEGGRVVELVREGDAWRVVDGGFLRAASDDPLSALAAFFDAVRRRDLEAVRALIPTAEALRFPDEASLAAHLEQISSRVEQARAGLEPLSTRRVEVRDQQALIPYGPHRVARLVHEEGRWRVQDLE